MSVAAESNVWRCSCFEKLPVSIRPLVMCREVFAILLLSLAFAAGCDGEGPTATPGAGRSVGAQVNENEYAKLRVQAIEQYAGSPVTPIRSPDEFIGAWEMRFGGPVGSNEVQWVYDFSRDGKVKVGDETWTWKLNQDGRLSFGVTMPPDPTSPGLEQGASSEEMRYAFKTKDGRLVLSNEDTSVIELLSKLAVGPGT